MQKLTLELPRYDDRLTVERSEMFPKTPFVIMGELHGVRYPEGFYKTEQDTRNGLTKLDVYMNRRRRSGMPEEIKACKCGCEDICVADGVSGTAVFCPHCGRFIRRLTRKRAVEAWNEGKARVSRDEYRGRRRRR
ncbi:hypothetical protein [Cloacibacillus sp. An23]|uniref:hypothetical protein n=1 Tax=Cloacibacillus sp. An23 TaxID=1965591 RepID=UPI0011774ED9|nr:hypothetical protein [Cloacibacillus sp. An23]